MIIKSITRKGNDMKLSQSYTIITDYEVMKLLGDNFFKSKYLDVNPVEMLKNKKIVWKVSNK